MPGGSEGIHEGWSLGRCEEVMVLLPLVVDDFRRRVSKRIGIALYAGANETL